MDAEVAATALPRGTAAFLISFFLGITTQNKCFGQETTPDHQLLYHSKGRECSKVGRICH
jgi:hypothetical protein